MIEGFFIGAVMNYAIVIYMLYFLTKVRYYPCIMNRIESQIKTFSYLISAFCFIASVMPYFSFRAVFKGFDLITNIAIFLQIVVVLFAFTLYNFHIKTTKNEQTIST